VDRTRLSDRYLVDARLGRRTLLALGGAALLAACGGSGGSSGAPGSQQGAPAPSGAPGAGGAGGFVLVQRYPNTALTPGSVRLPVSIATPDGGLLQDGPAELTGRILDGPDAGAAVLDDVRAARHATPGGIPYWPVTAELTGAGIYYLAVDGAAGEPTPFQLFDPAEVAIPTPGSALPAFDTPTVDDARGVTPICTRSPAPCPFHDVTLAQALETGLPVVYLVGTPAHCSTGTCAPGLDALVELADTYAGRATFVHAEIYADDAATEVAPAVTDLGLDYEPVVYVAGADGVVRERLDIVWDAADLDAALSRHLT